MKRSGPIVITGFMGCGKSKVAHELARRLDLSVVDLDQQVTERIGRSPAQLIVEDGEPAFRTIESNTLHELLETNAASVVALGGGAWIEAKNRDLISQYKGLSVWLDTPFETCWGRIEVSGEERPLGKTREQAKALFERRRPVYELASVHIPVATEETLDDLVERIEGELRGYRISGFTR